MKGEISDVNTGVRLTSSEDSDLLMMKTRTGLAKAKLIKIAVRRLIREWKRERKLVLGEDDNDSG